MINKCKRKRQAKVGTGYSFFGRGACALDLLLKEKVGAQDL
jgi:hypothetical protein